MFAEFDGFGVGGACGGHEVLPFAVRGRPAPEQIRFAPSIAAAPLGTGSLASAYRAIKGGRERVNAAGAISL